MPVLVIDAIHACFSHALLEQLVFYRHHIARWEYTVLFFKRQRFDQYKHNRDVVVDGRYTGWIGQWIDFLLKPNEVLFEHLGHKIPVVHGVAESPKIHPTLWDDGRVYPGRPIKRVPPQLDRLRSPYDSLMHVGRLQSSDPAVTPDSVWLVDRSSRFGRSMDPDLARTLFRRFPDMKRMTLDDWTPTKQIAHIRAAKMVVFRHGSILSNLIWARPGTIAVDMDMKMNRIGIVDRVCQLSGCVHVYVPYRDHAAIVHAIAELLGNRSARGHRTSKQVEGEFGGESSRG